MEFNQDVIQNFTLNGSSGKRLKIVICNSEFKKYYSNFPKIKTKLILLIFFILLLTLANAAAGIFLIIYLKNRSN
jgi:hypothetical protein